jgi:hypothetical protein
VETASGCGIRSHDVSPDAFTQLQSSRHAIAGAGSMPTPIARTRSFFAVVEQRAAASPGKA